VPLRRRLPWILILRPRRGRSSRGSASKILLQLSFEMRHRDPVRMLGLAKHAQEVADRIETTPYGPGFLSDLRTRAWAELANALRVDERYRERVFRKSLLMSPGGASARSPGREPRGSGSHHLPEPSERATALPPPSGA
jgi:hypothetical protein